ncbi:hypothetical protein, partial [Nostoc sp.]|uniref:hypothetical protein n=1 Tax=Nostoc sp. TaxID=1180 RepID=UPI002FF4562C
MKQGFSSTIGIFPTMRSHLSVPNPHIHQTRPSIFNDLIGRYFQVMAVEVQSVACEFISPQGEFSCIFLFIRIRGKPHPSIRWGWIAVCGAERSRQSFLA